MKNNSFEEIWKKLKSAKKVLMTLHFGPDGDSVGSCTALKYALEKEGVKVKLVSRDRLSENLESFKFTNEVQFGVNMEDEDLDKFDQIVLLDNGGLQDFSEEFKESLKNHFVVNIDHHATNPLYGKLNYVDGEASSTCLILSKFFKKVGVKFDRELSLRLLVGICTDTSFFLHGDSVDAMETAIFLLKIGKLNYARDLYDQIMGANWNLKKLHGIILGNLQKTKIHGKVVAYSWATKKDYEKAGLSEDDVKLAIVCTQDIKGLDLVFVISELDGGVKGSFRSRYFDTTPYSMAMGGGGHKKASGFRKEGIRAEEAVKQILKIVEEKGFVKAD